MMMGSLTFLTCLDLSIFVVNDGWWGG